MYGCGVASLGMKRIVVPWSALGVGIVLWVGGGVGAAGAPPPPPEFEAFEAWAGSRVDAAAGSVDHEAEGIRLAKARRAAMRELIMQDPQAALRLAWPDPKRPALPKAVSNLLEEPIRARGRLQVVFACPLVENTCSEPVIRTIELEDGRFYYAYTYGRRRNQLTSPRTSILGIAVDDRLALSDQLVRVLTPEEAARLDPGSVSAGVACPVCGDPVDASDGATLIDVGGEVAALHTAGEAADYVRAAGLEGIWAAGGTGSTGVNSPVNPPTTSQGNKRFLFMRVRFADDSPSYEPSTDATVRNDLDSVIQRFADMSYGTLQGSYAFTPTMTLPKPRSGYMNGWSSVDGMNALLDDAKAAAQALEDPPRSGIYPYRPSDFDLFAARWNGEPGGCCSYGGGGNAWIRWDGSDVLVHEWGHAIGLPHANSWDPDTDDPIGPGVHSEYGNTFDNMGGGGWRHFSAMKKAWMNWLPPERIHDIQQGGTYRIYVHDQPLLQSGNRYVARVSRFGRDDYQYWLEYRNHSVTGADAVYWSGGIGVMRDWDGQLLDMTPGSAKGKNDCTLTIGRTYSDSSAGIHITPVAAGTDGQAYIDVAVRFDEWASPNHAPVLALAASTLQTATGRATTFTADALDPDGDELAYAWDFGDGVLDIASEPVRQRTWSTPGLYTVRCSVSDLRGGTAVQSLEVRIGATSESSVSGMVLTRAGEPIPHAQVRDGTGRLAFTDTDGTYHLAGLPAGGYTLQPVRHPRAFNPGSRGALVAPDAMGVDFESPTPIGPGTGLIREYWLNIPGNLLSSLTRHARYPHQPDGSHRIADAFEIPENWQDDYGSRMRGYFVPPMSGGYRFYVASDDASVLYLSRDMSPNNRMAIAQVSGWTSPRDWTATASQQSDLLQLAAGQLYYIEAVHKEGGGGDHLAVGVDLPDGTRERPIPYHRLLALETPAPSDPVVTLEMTVPHMVEGGDPAVMTLRRTGAAAGPLDVYVHFSGTAQYGIDYWTPGLVHRFESGMATLVVPIEPVDDRTSEPMETLRVRLAAGPGYRVGAPDHGAALLADNDGTTTLTVVAADPYASWDGPDPGRFEIRRHGDSSGLLQVAYAVSGSAAAGTDYEPLPGSVTLQPGQAAAEVHLSPLPAAGPQPPKDVILTLIAGSGYSVASPANATVSLSRPGPGFGILREWWTGINGGNISDLTGNANYPANPTGREYLTGFMEGPRDWEDNYGSRFRGTFAPPLTGTYRFWIASDDGGELWLGSGPGAATRSRIAYVSGWSAFRAWDAQSNQRSGAIHLVAGNRYYIEALHKEGGGGDHLSVGVQFPNGIMERPLSTQWLEPWSDGPPLVAVYATEPVATESGQAGLFTFKRAGDAAAPLTVWFSRSGTATPGADFAALPSSVTFAAGASAASLPVVPILDTQTEGPETVVLTLTASGAYSRGVSDSATVTLVGDPPRASVQAIDTGAFRIALVSASFGPVTIQYRLGGTATPGIDYQALPGTVTLPPGQITATLDIIPETNTQNESAETVVLTLMPGSGYLPDPAALEASLVITHTPSLNTPPVLAEISDQSILAGRTLEIATQATDAEAPPQTLQFGLAEQPQGADINPVTGLFTWRPTIAQAGASHTVGVTVTDDGTPPLNATRQFLVSVATPAAPTLTLSAGVDGFAVGIDGDEGPDYTLEGSPDLDRWLPIGTADSPLLPMLWPIPDNPDDTNQFYRIRLGP